MHGSTERVSRREAEAGVQARTLRSGFLRAAEQGGDRVALRLDGQSYTFAELYERAASIAATLQRLGGEREVALTAVFGHRHVETFAGIVGVLLRGDGYVPLNPNFPPDRTRAMLVRSAVREVIVDASGRALLATVLEGVPGGLTLIAPDLDDVSELAAAFPQHRVLGRADLAPAASLTLAPVDENGIAYLLFTSGSTGIPKGVMVAHRNVIAFLDAMTERYAITERDRFSHTFDLTFDLSVFDLFLAWESGARVVCPTAQQKMLPAKYIQSEELTVWFSVPSTAVLMNKLRMLKPGHYPTLRWSLFCGEALPIDVLKPFVAAAPNAIAENLYGPTELTIACTLYRWHEGSEAESELGVVPIGEPYPNMLVKVVDESLREVAEGETGELLMTGPQLSLGYFRDADKTAAAFVTPPDEGQVFYRTGDRVRRMPPGKPLIYLGRVDNQIKIQGYRVELGEIEAVLREVSGADVAIAIGFPKNASGADGVVGFVGLDDGDAEAIRAAACARLPPYMQPKEVRFVSTFPLNANGKVDRLALYARLVEGAS